MRTILIKPGFDMQEIYMYKTECVEVIQLTYLTFLMFQTRFLTNWAKNLSTFHFSSDKSGAGGGSVQQG